MGTTQCGILLVEHPEAAIGASMYLPTFQLVQSHDMPCFYRCQPSIEVGGH